MAGALSASLIAFNTGCLVGLPSSLIPQLEAEPDPRLRVGFEEASWIATLYLMAGLPACIVGGYLSAKVGGLELQTKVHTKVRKHGEGPY